MKARYMKEHILLHRGTYHDSAFLMRISRELGALDGVSEAVVVMGTEMNRALLLDVGFSAEQLASATPMDMLVALRLEREGLVSRVQERLEQLLRGGTRSSTASSGSGEPRYPSLPEAMEALPAANIVSIAVAGPYATHLAHQALAAGRHVFLFSDNVPLDDEIRLKRLGRELGLLVMGPDCGTSIIDGTGLGFTNRVPRGSIGLAGPSGTGIQELSCLVARGGGGISQAIGTGGRDLSAPVGGLMTTMALDMLDQDPSTRVMVLVAKPPDGQVADELHRKLRTLSKPVVVRYLGRPPASARDGVNYCSSIDEAARLALALSGTPSSAPPADEARQPPPSVRGRLVGLFAGGSLTLESAEILRRHGIAAHLTHQLLAPGRALPPQPHFLVDTGGDLYTRGRPHPMVDQDTGLELMEWLGSMPDTGILLMDLVLGDGAHPDPAPGLASTMESIKRKLGAKAPLLVCSITGVARDPQDPAAQRGILEQAGARVFPSATTAATFAARALRQQHRGNHHA